MNREYGLNKDKCYFCGHDELVLTNEHYYFCPNCMALFTFVIVWQGCGSVSECIKSGDRVPTTFHPPMYKEARSKVYIKRSITFNDSWCCSKCGSEVHADGW